MKANPVRTPVPDLNQILTAKLRAYQAWVLAGRPPEGS